MIPLIAIQSAIVLGAVAGVYSGVPLADLFAPYLMLSLIGTVILDMFTDKYFDERGVGRSKGATLSAGFMSMFTAILFVALIYGINLIPASANFTLFGALGEGISAISAVTFLIVALFVVHILVLPNTHGSWAFTSMWVACAVAKLLSSPSVETAWNYIITNMVPWKFIQFFIWLLQNIVHLLVGSSSTQEAIASAIITGAQFAGM